jgi:hypothetical protein
MNKMEWFKTIVGILVFVPVFYAFMVILLAMQP